MNTALNIVGTNELSEESKQEIDIQIDRIISKHRDNRYEINKLVFESVSALTASENYSSELASQGVIKRFWGGITGKNRDLQNEIDRSLAATQYASQQTLQKLTEQNLMSFELITAVNNKLNASIVQVEEEINKIYGTLVTFFKQTKSDIVQLENRVTRLEKNVNLLNWQNSIEYQMWDGVEYIELDTISKIVCVIRDFYEITQGEWNTSDLLLLKSAMSDIGLNANDLINVRQFLIEICNKYDRFSCIIPPELQQIDADVESSIIMSYIQKEQKLFNSEHYLIDYCQEMTGGNSNEIKFNLTDKFVSEKAGVNLNCNVKVYDLIIEILYNINMLREKEKYVERKQILSEAEKLFWQYRWDEAGELLEKIINSGSSRANFLMALIYEKGCNSYEVDFEKAKQLFDYNIERNDLLSKAYTECKPFYQGIYFSNTYQDNSWKFDEEKLSDDLEILKDEYETGDILVDYIYSKLNILLVRFSANYFDYEMDEDKVSPYMEKLLEMSELGNFVAKLEYAEQVFISGYYDDAQTYFYDLDKYGIGRVHYYLGEYCGWGYGEHKQYGQKADETKMYRYMGKKEKDILATLNTAYVTDDQTRKNDIFNMIWEKVRDSARMLDITTFYEYGDLVKNGYGVSADTEYAKYLYQLGANAGSWKCRKKLEDF